MSNPAPEDPKAVAERKDAQRREWLIRRQKSIQRQLAAIDNSHAETLKANLAEVKSQLAQMDKPAAKPKKSE